jgi:hypothetical protein
MNEKEVNEAFDHEYEKYKNSPEYNVNLKVVTDTTTQYYKIKMPTYYIAKHSDEDLRAAVLAERLKCSEDYLNDCAAAVEAARLEEREACAKLCESMAHEWGICALMDCATAIRGRTE